MALTGCGANTDEQKSSSTNNDGKNSFNVLVFMEKIKLLKTILNVFKEFNETIGKEKWY